MAGKQGKSWNGTATTRKPKAHKEAIFDCRFLKSMEIEALRSLLAEQY